MNPKGLVPRDLQRAEKPGRAAVASHGRVADGEAWGLWLLVFPMAECGGMDGSSQKRAWLPPQPQPHTFLPCGAGSSRCFRQIPAALGAVSSSAANSLLPRASHSLKGLGLWALRS